MPSPRNKMPVCECHGVIVATASGELPARKDRRAGELPNNLRGTEPGELGLLGNSPYISTASVLCGNPAANDSLLF
jgi:hypothetical protein